MNYKKNEMPLFDIKQASRSFMSILTAIYCLSNDSHTFSF